MPNNLQSSLRPNMGQMGQWGIDTLPPLIENKKEGEYTEHKVRFKEMDSDNLSEKRGRRKR